MRGGEATHEKRRTPGRAGAVGAESRVSRVEARFGARRWVGAGVTSCPDRRADRSYQARPLTRASLAGRSNGAHRARPPLHRPAGVGGCCCGRARGGGVCGLGRFGWLRLCLRAGRGEALRCRPCCRLRVTTGARDVVTRWRLGLAGRGEALRCRPCCGVGLAGLGHLGCGRVRPAGRGEALRCRPCSRLQVTKGPGDVVIRLRRDNITRPRRHTGREGACRSPPSGLSLTAASARARWPAGPRARTGPRGRRSTRAGPSS